jgi:putative ABC transport system permease protein
LLRGEAGGFYMEAAWLEKISGVEGVSAVSPQLFVASLNAACCSAPVQLIGFDQDSDFIVGPWIRTAMPGALKDGEVVVGSAIVGKVGDAIQFFDRDYRIVAKMENTGTGFDASVFMNMGTARAAAAEYTERTGAASLPDGAISSVIVLIDGGSTASGVANRINHTFDYGNSGIVVVPAKKIVSGVSLGLRALKTAFGALAAVLWLSSLFVLGVVFSVMLNERKHELGILRSLGVTKRRLTALVLLESGAISAAGGAAGVFLAALLLIPFRVSIREMFDMPYMTPGFWQLFSIACLSVALSAAAVLLASLFSSARIGKADAYRTIREGGL